MEEFKRILVVSRMTKHCREAVHFGISLARKYNAELSILHVVHNPFGLEGWNLPIISLEKEYEKIFEEAKADLDVVKLKKEYAGRLAFVGNVDVRVLERGNPGEIRREVLYKLQAARGGGWVFQSDHSISWDVAPESYELAIKILRECGNYPLAL